MDPCVTDGAEPATQSSHGPAWFQVPLYMLPSLLHLGIVYTVSQGPKS